MRVDTQGPLPVERRAQLLDTLKDRGTVRVSELSRVLGVTPITVRRDITQLAEDGLVHRVHGGVALAGAAAGERTGLRSVGMLVPSLDYYWPGVIAGAEEAAARHGLRVALRGSSYEADDTHAQLSRMIDQLGASALLIAPNMAAAHTAEALEWLGTTGLPVVLVERRATGLHHARLESVVSDHALGGAMAVRHLAALGHRTIGLVTSRQSPHGPLIRRGWLEAAAEVGFDPARTVDATVGRPPEPGTLVELAEVVDRALATGTTGMVVHADAEAIALVQVLEARGLSVPGDVSVVAYDDEVAKLFTPRLTAIRPPRRSLGRAAVDLVAARLADPGRPAHRVVISPSLRVRDSTAAPPRPP